MMLKEADCRTPARPDPATMASVAAAIDKDPVYAWSFLLTRMIIGILGLALPMLLVVADWWLGDGFRIRGSLSAYYHSGARDVFVGTLFMTGIFLISYKVFSRTRENMMSSVAGVAAVGVALFPTGLPEAEEGRLTPLQQELGESVVTQIHFACAFVFIGMLGVICCLFAKREATRTEQDDPHWQHSHTPAFWGSFHYLCAGAIAAAVLFVAVTKALGLWQGYSLLFGEVMAVAAFGASWLAKGSELRRIWPRRSRSSPAAMPVAAR